MRSRPATRWASSAPGNRLVVFEGVEAWKPPDAKEIATYLKSPAPGTTLALVAGDLRKDAPLAKAVTGHGTVLLWDVLARAVPRWIAEQFKLSGVTVEPEACRLLAELVGDDLYELASEIEKLVTWAGGERDHRGRCRGARRAARKSPPWDLTDAWGARDVGGVLRATERMLDRTGDPSRRRSRGWSARSPSTSGTPAPPSGSRTKGSPQGSRDAARDQAVSRAEALRAGPELQRLRAGRRADPPCRARPRAQRRLAAVRRARARADARRDHRALGG